MASSDWDTYKRLLSYLAPYWFLFAISVLGFLLAAGAEGYFVRLFGNLIDEWDNEAARAAATIPLLMAAAAGFRAIGTVIGESVMAKVSFNMVFNLRQQLFDQLLRLPNHYFDANAQGHIVSRITFTVTQLRDTSTDAIRAIVQDGLKVIVIVGFMLALNWRLTLIFIASAPLLALVVVFASGRFRRIAKRIQHSMGDVTHVVSEAVNGFKVVKTFGGERYEQSRFDRASKVNRQQNLKMAMTRVFSSQLNETIIAVALCSLILLLYRPDVGGSLSGGEAVMFLSWAGMLGRPIRKLSEINAKLQRGIAAAEDVFTQLDAGVERDSGSRTLTRADGRLLIENVSFRYQDDGPDVLQDINLDIAAGQKVALVGRSGSGKSTLASLLPRFYDVRSGSISLDGSDINDLQLACLRQQIALVTQQVTLFNDTLRNNIAYGDLADVDESDLILAIERAHADEFIAAMPDGLDTMVGDDGVLLSGGQRQRIAIARALLKDAPVLIMDEATSALDNESEKHIQAALVEVMEGRTTLVIAHRLSTIESADRIVVLENGRIVEEGTHQQLLDSGAQYANLHAAQFQDAPELEGLSDTMREPVAVAASSQTLPFMGVYASRSASALSSAWYSGARWPLVLLPLSWLYGVVAGRIKRSQQQRALSGGHAAAPVIVVGNITAGGTGKTPMVIWLVEQLQCRGFSPGVAMRGYKGKASRTGSLVPADGNSATYGDEAVLMRRRLHCAVAVAADRPKAVAMLIQDGCDVVVSDDGLQHYAMQRDIEIAVVDGARGLGNGRLLPAGPLREPRSRLETVDWVVSNGRKNNLRDDEITMQAKALDFVNLSTGMSMSADQFARDYRLVHALCGIGNPMRFLRSLQALGLSADLHEYADHHDYSGAEVMFSDELQVVCTEKDAVKLRELDQDLSHVWALRIELGFASDISTMLDALLSDKGIAPRKLKTDQR
ncbi:MAG TPA: lipid ABC transporter permease [Gammaproteobacteria bacterium]|nr:lipid ABC transporter permease [Gammaproteobacteria bacterium]